MDLINKEFENLVKHLYLTENISLLVYSLIRTTRPISVIEFGAGYSTLCIAKAFEDIQKEEYDPTFASENWKFLKIDYPHIDNKLHKKVASEWYKKFIVDESNQTGTKYKPKLITVDNSNEIGTNKNNCYDEIPTILERLNLLNFVEFVKDDWMNKIKNLKEDEKFDFVWIDIGSGLEYKEVFDLIFPKLNPAGVVAFHNVATNVASRWFLSEIKLKCKMSDEFEMMTFLEPHKKRQNSIVLIKKNCDYPIYNPVAV